MNIHEYQGKAVLKAYGANVSAGFPAASFRATTLGTSASSRRVSVLTFRPARTGMS